jgi:hypothetical protein
MAIGDDATAAGFPLVPSTGEDGRVRWSPREDNRTRDFIAQVKNLIPVGKSAYRSASGITYSTLDPSGGSDGDVHFKVSSGVTTTFVRSGGVWVQNATSSGGTGGVTVHSELTGRSDAGQHPIGAITSLTGALDSKASTSDPRLSDARTPTSHGNEAHGPNFVDGVGVNRIQYVTEANYPASPVTGVLYVVF